MPNITLRDRLRLAKRALVGTFDADSAKVAWGLLSGIFPGAAGTPPTRGTEEFLKAYSTMPWLRAVAGRVAGSIASTDWQLFVARRNGGKAVRQKALQRAPFFERKSLIQERLDSGELQRLEEHPLLDLIDNGNPVLTGLAVRKVTQLHLDIVGEAFWLKERDGLQTPTGIWPIPPNWIMATPTPARRGFRVSFRGWQGEIPDTEFVWFADPDPWNPYGRGTGAARALADELETDEYAAKFLRQRFFNQARPDFLVFPKGENTTLKDSEVVRLQQRWLDEHQGFWRQFKPMFLSREVGIHEFGAQDFRELQMVQLRQNERDTIIQTFGGFPPEMLGIHESSNRSMIEAASFMFALWTLVPRLEFQRAVMQERLVPEFDERLILDYASPVEEDKEFALKAATAAPWAPTVDEWRTKFQGLPEKEDGSGKVHMVPFSLTPTQDLGAVPEPIEVPALPPGGPRAVGNGNGGGKTAAQVKEWRAVLSADARAFRDAGDLEGERACLKALADDPDDLPALVRLASRLEPRFRREFLEAVEAAKDGVDVEALSAALLSGSLSQIEAAAQVEALASRTGDLAPLLRQGFLVGAGFAHQDLSAAGLTMNFDLVNPHAQAWTDRHGAELVTEVTDEQRRAIQEILREASAGTRDVRSTARAIRDVIGLHSRQANAVERFRRRLEEDGTLTNEQVESRVSRYAQAQLRLRARTIARTEVLRSSSEGQLGLWREARNQGLLDPAKTRRKWIVTPDDRLDLAICEPMDGERGIVPLGEPWELSDGRKVMVPQEAHPQCRCAAGLVFKEAE